jgi:hypothetical protein
MYANLEVKMTKEKYFEVQEQLGKEPDPEKIPPDLDDFPEIVQNAMIIFNSLGDRVYPDVGYIGKDYTNLPHYIKIYYIDDVEFLLEILNWLDNRAIKKSSELIKREMDKLKRKK